MNGEFNPNDVSGQEPTEVSLNKLVGLMECGIEPKLHDGDWTVEVVDHLHQEPVECHVENGVIAQLKRFDFGEVVQRGNETVFTLKEVA